MKKQIKILTLLTLILTTMTTNAETILEQKQIIDKPVIPSENFNIQLKVNKASKLEEYTYFDRKTYSATTYKVLDGQVVSKTITNQKSFHPYSLLYKEGSPVIWPNINDVYFSYVTLPDPVDYIYQLETGKYKFNNCAPTSIAMAYNWANDLKEDTGLTASWIRNTYSSIEENADITTLDENTLLSYNISQIASIYRDLGLEVYESTQLLNSKDLIEWLNKGFLLNLAVDSAKLDYATDKTSNINRSYRGGGGHSILCTGYLYVIVEDKTTGKTNEQLYFEIVDPVEGEENKVRYYTEASIDEMLASSFCRYVAISHK